MTHLFRQKTLFSAIFLLIFCTTAAIAADNVKKGTVSMKSQRQQTGKIKGIVLPTRWKLFKSPEFTAQDAAAARFEDDFLIPFQGKKKIKASWDSPWTGCGSDWFR